MADDVYLGGIMEFTKMQGCGNDYVYVNGFENKIDNPNKLSDKAFYLTDAPAEQYYYMTTSASVSNLHVTGRYTP